MNSSVLMALSRHDGGSLVENADELMKQIARDVIRYGGTGKLTINLSLKANGDSGGLKLSADVRSTSPKRPHSEAFYYTTEDFDLTRTPPKDEADNLLRSIPSGVAKA